MGLLHTSSQIFVHGANARRVKMVRSRALPPRQRRSGNLPDIRVHVYQTPFWPFRINSEPQKSQKEPQKSQGFGSALLRSESGVA